MLYIACYDGCVRFRPSVSYETTRRGTFDKVSTFSIATRRNFNRSGKIPIFPKGVRHENCSRSRVYRSAACHVLSYAFHALADVAKISYRLFSPRDVYNLREGEEKQP